MICCLCNIDHSFLARVEACSWSCILWCANRHRAQGMIIHAPILKLPTVFVQMSRCSNLIQGLQGRKKGLKCLAHVMDRLYDEIIHLMPTRL